MAPDPKKRPVILAALIVALGPERLIAHDPDEVHPAMTENAIDIVRSRLLSLFEDEIIEGSKDADDSGGECGHAYNPVTQKGYPKTEVCDHARDALDTARDHWKDAVDAYKAKRYAGDEGAFRLLGRTLHIIQDLTCPAHVHSDFHPDGDDFEKWAEENFQPLSGLEPLVPGDGSIEDFVLRAAGRTYEVTSFQGEIFEFFSPQPESTLQRMFPSLVFIADFVDPRWTINDIGSFEDEGVLNAWLPGEGDFTEDEGGPAESRRIRGNFYIRNSAGDSGNLTPAIWQGAQNTKTLLQNYGDELFPLAVRLSAGLLQTFVSEVCEAPDVRFSADSKDGCAPLRVEFEDESEGFFPSSWEWSFGDGSKSDERNPSHTYDEPGSYAVTLTVTDLCDTKTERAENFIRVRAPSEASFTASPGDGCAPLSVKLRDTSKGQVKARVWDFGDGATSQDADPTHVYTAPGKYTVTLTVSGECGSDTEARKDFVQAFGASVPDFDVSKTSGCAPLQVKFTDGSSGLGNSSWKWSFGDGSGSTQRNPSHTYEKAGEYTVTLTVAGDCGGGTLTKEELVRVRAVAEPDFSASVLEGCPPLQVQFTDTSKGDGLDRWLWDFGDSTQSGEKSPVHVFKNPGKYAVSLRVDGDCGLSNTARREFVRVIEPAKSAFKASVLEGCAPLEVKFADASAGEGLSSWRWDFGEGASSSERSPSHTFATRGEFPVVLTVLGRCGGEVSSTPAVISVRDVPDPPPAITNPLGPSGAAFEGDVLSIEWPAVDDAEGYRVEAMVTGKSDWFEACIPGEGRLSCRRPLDASGEWKFRVTPFNECGNGVPREGGGIPVSAPPIIAIWPFDCGPGATTATSVPDIAQGNNGSVIGTVFCSDDRFGLAGKALRFEGAGGVEGEVPPVNDDFTLGLWFFPSKEASREQAETVLGIQSPGAPPLGLTWEAEGGILQLPTRREAPALQISNLVEEAWHHIVVTRSKGTTSLIVDGIEAGSRKDPLSLPGGFVFGAAPETAPLHGALDGARFEARARNASEAIDLALSEGPGLHVFPADGQPAVTAPRATCELLRMRFVAGASQNVFLDDARLQIEDVTDPASGPPPGGFAYLKSGRLVLRPDCKAAVGEVVVGTLAIGPTSPGKAAVNADVRDDAEIEAAQDGCLVALFDLAKDAPVGRVFRGSLAAPDDLVISGEKGEPGFVLGRRIAGLSAVEGDSFTIRQSLPPVLVLEAPEPPAVIPAKVPLVSVELHRSLLSVRGQGGPRDAVGVKRVTYAAGSGLDAVGLENPVLFLALGGKADPGIPVTQGRVDRAARTLTFENLPIEIVEDSTVTFIVRADLTEAPPPAPSARASLPVPPGALRSAAMGFALLALMALGTALHGRRTARRAASFAAALAAGATLLLFTGGCGGGGGGDRRSPAVGPGDLQLTIRGSSDVDAAAATDGAPATIVLPAEGVPGPVYRFR